MSLESKDPDPQVPETINSALGELHLDDLEESKDDSLSLRDDNVNNNRYDIPIHPSGMFPHPPPQIINPFLPYPHLMHIPHHSGFFHPLGVSNDHSSLLQTDSGVSNEFDNPLIIHSEKVGLNIDISKSGVDPLWSGVQNYQFIHGSSFSIKNSASSEGDQDTSLEATGMINRRQPFQQMANANVLEKTAISESKVSSNTESKNDNSSSATYPAAAYPYGNSLLHPNPVLSGHLHSTQNYGIPSPFPGYGFNSPFSPIHGTPLNRQPGSLPLIPPSVNNLSGTPPLESSTLPHHSSTTGPWIYSSHGNHPFSPHMVPSHQMMTNSHNMHRLRKSPNIRGNKRGNHSSIHANRENGKFIQRVRLEDASRYADAKLEDYIGNIYSLCKDQHGCRFLQKQLDLCGVEAATAIFEETKYYVVELMTDSFGNYLIQKLLERVNENQRITLVKSASSQFVDIALDPHGTRALQKLVECIGTEREAGIIVNSLKEYVVELSRDLNGNHVVQKCLQKLKPKDSQFIFDAACRECVKIATHRHGCCVLQRCLDYGNEEQRQEFCEKIINHVDELTLDPFGNYVIQYILTKEAEEGFGLEYTNKIVKLLKPRVIDLSLHKFGSNVVERILRTSLVSEVIITELLSHDNESGIERLLHDCYGNYVLQTALDIAKPTNNYLFQRLHNALKPLLVGPIRNTPHGRRIMSILQME